MRRLITKDTFTQVPLTSGTIQNASGIKTVEVSDVQEEGSGILLLPLNKISFTGKTLYVRCVDGAGAEVVVVPFEVDAGGGGGGSSGGLSGVTADFSLDQFGTGVVENFTFSALEYPNATNPNLDGKTVLVMAVKDANETTQLVKYIFVDLTELVGTATLYKSSDNAIGISGASIGLNLSASAGNILSVADDGLYARLGVADGVSGNFAVIGESGAIIDGGFSLADLVVGGGSGGGASYAVATHVLNGLMSAVDKTKLDGLENYTLPTASANVKGGVKIGGGLSMVGDVLNVTLQNENYTLPTASTTAKGGVVIGGGLSMSGDTLSVTLQPESYTLPTATATQKGGVAVGNGLSMNGDTLNVTVESYTLPTATTSTKGGVVIGGGLSMSGDTLSVTLQPESYTLPTATATQKGGVAVGNGLSMNGDTLNVTVESYTLPTATTSTKGGVVIGGGLSMAGDTLSVTIQSETYTLPTASTTTKGGVKIGSGLQMDGDTLSVTLQSGSSGGTVLNTVPATVDGGIWFEMFNGKPVLKLRKGDYNYVFENSRIQRVTASEYLVAWLRFNQSTTYDECGIHTWEAVGSPTIGSTNSFNGHALQLNADSYVQCTDGITLGGRDFTIDCWFYSHNSSYYNEVACIGETSSDTSTRISMGLYDDKNLGMATPGWRSVPRNAFLQLADPTNNFIYSPNHSVIQDIGLLGNYAATADQTHFTEKLLHYALVYKHDRRRVYGFLNGICFLSFPTDTCATARTHNYVGIGKGHPSNAKFTGAISEFRIHDGVALWTENFTPPTAADYL